MEIKKTCGIITLELDQNENFTRIVEKGGIALGSSKIFIGVGTYGKIGFNFCDGLFFNKTSSVHGPWVLYKKKYALNERENDG